MPQRPDFTLGDLEQNADIVSQVVTAYYRDMMYYAVRGYGLDESDAEGLVQQVFFELWKDRQTGIRNKEVPIRQWLFQRLRHRCLNDVVRARRQQAGYRALDESREVVDITASQPLDDAMHQDLITCLREGVSKQLRGRT